MPLEPATFRQSISCFATGIAVVTTRVDGVVHGMTVNSLCSISLEPSLLAVSIGHSRRMHAQLLRSELFGVSILAADQERLARHFAGQPTGAVGEEALFLSRGTQHPPALRDCLAFMACRIVRTVDIGDHTLFAGEVTESLGRGDTNLPPLLFHRSMYAVPSALVRPVSPHAGRAVAAALHAC